MNPINGESSQNQTILDATNKIETTKSKEQNEINNSEIQTKDETKDMDKINNLEEIMKNENDNVLKEQSADVDITKIQKKDDNKDIGKEPTTEKPVNSNQKEQSAKEIKHNNANDTSEKQLENKQNNDIDEEENKSETSQNKITKHALTSEKSAEKHEVKENTSDLLPKNNKQKAKHKECKSEIAEVVEEREYDGVDLSEEVEELIVPDEADAEDLTSCNGDEPDKLLNEDEVTKDSDADDLANEGDKTFVNENKISKENKCPVEEDLSKDTEDEQTCNLEPELVAIEDRVKDSNMLTDETTNDGDDLVNNEGSNKNVNDPLNCTNNQEQEEKEGEDGKYNDDNGKDLNNDDDEEDDVQFIETRNSPICIESDDDDVNTNNTNSNTNTQTITTPTATITVPKNIIVTRTSARKSTAKSQKVAVTKTTNSKTVPQIQNKPKNFSYLKKATYYRQSAANTQQQHIVDCIDLLDSSDEESSASRYRPSSVQQVKTPQKRTLLAAKGSVNKMSNKNDNTRGNVPTNFSPQIKKQIKKPAPPPLPPPTPQSNFLNAVQLQPAVSGVNPPAFSALLSNKNVIIPNAFYGNPVQGKSDIEVDRRYARWLENFLNQFCNPHLVVTHSCFLFLQKSLKYKDFARIKNIRSNMNNQAQTAVEQLNNNLMVDLRTILLKNQREVTNHGRRFCEFTCNTPGKGVALMAHSVSGRVTMKTCNMDIPKTSFSSSSASSTSTGTNSLSRKRQLEDDEDEYMPDKQKLKTTNKPPSENGDSGENSDHRKRSLRTKRTKRIDNSFSYNEDELLAEFEIDDEDEAAEKIAMAEIQRKIDQKRMEAQRQREQQVKSFESAFIQAFAKSVDRPTTSTTSSKITKNASNQRIRLRNSTTSTTVQQYAANNDTEDLLQATWVDNDDTQVISDDDEPKVHRIYKKQEEPQYDQQHQYQSRTKPLTTKHNTTPKSAKQNKRPQQQQDEIITGDDDYIENDHFYNNSISDIDISQFPNNIDREMHVNGKYKDKCVICNIQCQRIVHHYVNEHRGSEVYNSRLTTSQIQLLRHANCSDSIMSMYKNGQPQYEAYCIFCQKKSRFMLPYWFQHFTMHTGEYAYRCSGCGVRKPTRSLLTQHQTQGCPEDGSIIQDYSHDAKSSKVEARVCTLCNYVQLHRGNIVKHLHQQHDIRQILPKHIQTIVLLKTPTTKSSPPPTTTTPSSVNISMKRSKISPVVYNQSSSSSTSSAHNTYVIDDDEPDCIIEQQEESGQSLSPTEDTQNHYYNYIPPYMQTDNAAAGAANFTWEDNDPEDISFVICGMLDVQMNTEGN